MDQEQVFLQSEGNQWFERNQSLLQSKEMHDDILVKIIRELELVNTNAPVLEIGCSNGYRLDYLQQQYSAKCIGIEPSKEANDYAKKHYSNIEVKQATADDMPLEDNAFDLVIIGFCLCVCSPDKLFKIVSEVDRVLKDNGNLMVCDFFAPIPYQNDYAHTDSIAVHKMNYSQLFLAHPFYHAMYNKVFNYQCENFSENYNDNLQVSVLHKKTQHAFVKNPF